MPGEQPGWRRVLADDFQGTSLNRWIWQEFYGQAADDPGGWWEPSHVTVHDGILDLATYRDPVFGGRWVSGGVSSAPGLGERLYGKFIVRFRVDSGLGVAAALLLSPGADRPWPPEIDFAENSGETNVRHYMTATLHYDNASSFIQRSVSGNFSSWHTMGVEWKPGHITFSLDGKSWATLAEHVPDSPMYFNMQAQAGTCGTQYTPCPNAKTPTVVRLQVDWAVVYEPA